MTKDIQKIYPLIQIRNTDHLQNRVEEGDISWGKVRSIIGLIVQMKKSVHPNYMNKDKDLLIVASAKIGGDHGLPLEFRGVAQKWKNLVKAVKYRCGDYDIQEESSLRYLRKVINRVNKKGDKHEIQTTKSHSELVKVSSFSNNQATWSDPRLAWFMFHKIAVMYKDMKHQDNLLVSLAIQNPKSPKYIPPSQPYQPSETSLPVNLQEVSPDLPDIQPHPS